MNEELQMILDMVQEKMDNSIEHLNNELNSIRAGKASPRMLDGLMIDYYGSQTPLSQVANVNTPDARTIAIQPWEKTLIPDIERAIINSNLGLNPENNGEIIRLNVPPLTEERRKSLVKDANNVGENAKIAIRSARKDANDTFKKMLKDSEISEDQEKNLLNDVQDFTNSFIKKIDELLKEKEADILTV
ncbi:ribosome recycling factor [Halosquirtibacter laminarini]|uniref:Ribosome recycling factor n=1 Tax=Halosquirtibacter laminarini TaxID=3374600 RepID=A0AC61NN33_9BACT|nr:ribosome recycling factor [Prolixibacteraceae bacterium]